MRVAVGIRKISFDSGVGGMERAAALHIEKIIEQGCTVELYTPKRFFKGNLPVGVRLHDVSWPAWDNGGGRPTFSLAYAVWSGELARKLSKSSANFEIIHLHGAAANSIKSLKISAPVVVNPHGMEEFGRSSLLKLPFRLLLRSMVRQAKHADYVIATDEVLKSSIRKNIGAQSEDIYKVPNVVDVSHLRALALEEAPDIEIFEEDSVSGKLRITSIGRIAYNKGYDLLAEALGLLLQEKKLPANWIWTHFGNGTEKEKLIDAASKRLILNNLRIVSDASDAIVQSYLSRSAIFVQPSRYEGSSLTTLEAMAHGVVVVGTPVGGIPEKIRDGVTGYLAEGVTPHHIANALSRAIESLSTGQSLQLREAALELVRADFDAHGLGDRYLALYVAAQRKFAERNK